MTIFCFIAIAHIDHRARARATKSNVCFWPRTSHFGRALLLFIFLHSFEHTARVCVRCARVSRPKGRRPNRTRSVAQLYPTCTRAYHSRAICALHVSYLAHTTAEQQVSLASTEQPPTYMLTCVCCVRNAPGRSAPRPVVRVRRRCAAVFFTVRARNTLLMAAAAAGRSSQIFHCAHQAYHT